MNICQKKQWHTFKVQGVKRKRRASLGLTTGVGSIYSVPSPNGEAKRNFEFVGKDKRQTAGVIVERNEQKLRGGEV